MFQSQAMLFLLRSLPYDGPTVQLAGASAVIIHSFLPQVFVFHASSVRGLHWALGAEKDKTHPCPCGVTPVSSCNLGAQGRTGVTQGQDTRGAPTPAWRDKWGSLNRLLEGHWELVREGGHPHREDSK